MCVYFRNNPGTMDVGDSFQWVTLREFTNFIEKKYKCFLSIKTIISCQCEKLRKPSFIDSMEQLWLAFVMKEKFNKVWDDGEWKWKERNDETR